ncbi:hypothetical protein ACJEIK_26420 [Mycobacterium sp. SMC-16]|uniref:hypothetical protein n=1 Tax=Mycobacterium sp. SMC-16 TaxID=3385967 RepID=UPI00390C5992
MPDRSGVRALLHSADTVAARIGGDAVVDAELVRTADEWAEVIKADLNSAVQGIVAAGQHLARAKADVRHGEWLPMLKQIGISQSAAKRLMSIAANPAISNRPTLGDLPSSIVALAELSRLPAEEIESGIADGSITSETTITEAKALANPGQADLTAARNAAYDELVRTQTVDAAAAKAAGIYNVDTEITVRVCPACGGWEPNEFLMGNNHGISRHYLAQLDTGEWAYGGKYFGQMWCVALDLTASHASNPNVDLSPRQIAMLGRLRPEVRERFDHEVAALSRRHKESAPGAPADPVPPAPNPPVSQKNRQPLALQAQNAGLDLQRAIRRIERLFNDANNAQRKKLGPELINVLEAAVANCQLTIEHIKHPGEVFIDTLGADS